MSLDRRAHDFGQHIVRSGAAQGSDGQPYADHQQSDQQQLEHQQGGGAQRGGPVAGKVARGQAQPEQLVTPGDHLPATAQHLRTWIAGNRHSQLCLSPLKAPHRAGAGPAES